MKIKDAAELTGTTVRTIRWYHQEGLVPVPPVHAGRRDYSLEHVARVLRVRWLAQAGLSLGAIRDLLVEEPPDEDDGTPTSGPELPGAIHDLYATLEHIDGAIEHLHGQRERVLHLIDSAESGRGLSSIPREISEIYERLERAVPHDAHIQRVLRRERRMAEMLCQRGLIRGDVIDAFSMDEEAVEQCVDFLVRFAGITEVPENQAEETMTVLADDMLAWCLRHRELVELYLAVIPGWSTPGIRSVVLRLLMLEYRDPRQRELIRRTLDGLNHLIDRGAFEQGTPAGHPYLAAHSAGDPS